MFTLPENWLTVRRGNAPLVVSLPHTGRDLPPELEARVVSPWLARKDCDWWIDDLYAFAADLDATIIHTALSRTLIDVNRDPSGVSLYPGQATTELCPSTTFDGEPLYKPGRRRMRRKSRCGRSSPSIPITRLLRASFSACAARIPAWCSMIATRSAR